MNPIIRIDDEVYEALKDEAEAFVDTPNSVIRRLLGLPGKGAGEEPAVADSAIVQGQVRAATEGPAPARTATNGGTRRTQRHRARKPKRTRVPKGALLPETEYEVPLLEVLAERGGRAPTREVIDALEERISDRLTELDRTKNAAGQPRWRNRAQFARLHLVERGDMVKDSPRGVWEISEQGRRRVGALV